uniref:Cytochrome P450 705A36 n=1 Tax=Isatis tinctoria TaxID=161756 RepID=A0A8F0FRY9_ISATI|nr:cytochrome P450 705A36 [Isatis tinctoria]
MATIILDFQNCFIFIVLCLFSLFSYRFFFKKPKDVPPGYDLPPSPPSLPFIGHLHLLLSVQPYKSFQKLFSTYGPLLYLRVFNAPFLLVSSASVAYEMYKTHDVNLVSHGTLGIDESLLSGSSSFVMAPYGPYWKFLKKLMVTKMLGPQALERSRGIRAKELARFHAILLHKAKNNESVEIGLEAMKLTNNIICRISMGTTFSEENGEAERLRGLVTESFSLVKKIVLRVILRKPLEKLGISPFKKEIMGVSQRFDDLLEKILREHEEKLDEHQGTDMMDALLTAYQDTNAEYRITRNQMKAFLVDLLTAGTDTTAQAMQWTMAEILNNRNILERLREEMESVDGKTRLVQETDLPNLPFLQAVVKEGLRLHPPIPLLPRVFEEGCKIRGFYVPAETPVLVNAYAVMRDPEYWERPCEFLPERFLAPLRSGQEDERKEQALKFLPFAGGRRACPASNLAQTSIVTAIGTMVQGFDWIVEGDKVHLEEGSGLMTMSMARPLMCTPVARSQYFTTDLQDGT